MTKPLYVVSTTPHAGKSAVCLALAFVLRDEGVTVSYMKPVGARPMRVQDVYVDEDAYVAWDALGISVPWECASPVLLTDGMRAAPLTGPVEGLEAKITQALAKLADGKDIVVLEGLGRTFEGSALGLAADDVAELTDAAVLLVLAYRPDLDLDSMLHAQQVFGDRLVGIVINDAPPRLVETTANQLQPFLEERGLKLFGVLARDPVLCSVTVGELAEELGAEVLCAEEKLGELVQSFSLGAMTGDSAYRYFQRKANKAVITGGDRSDVIMAALRTSTACLILTGNLRPEVQVLSAAAEQGVPMLLVKEDSLTTTQTVERVIGHIRISSPKQIARLRDSRSAYQELAQSVKAALKL